MRKVLAILFFAVKIVDDRNIESLKVIPIGGPNG
jgi:hypothetical protein